MTIKLIYNMNFKLDYILKVNDILILRVSDTAISKCHLLLELILLKNCKKILAYNYNICYNYIARGEIAQLARAFGSYPKGREFESPSRYQEEFCSNFYSFEFDK